MNKCKQDKTFFDHDASLLYSSWVNPSSVWTILLTLNSVKHSDLCQLLVSFVSSLLYIIIN